MTNSENYLTAERYMTPAEETAVLVDRLTAIGLRIDSDLYGEIAMGIERPADDTAAAVMAAVTALELAQTLIARDIELNIEHDAAAHQCDACREGAH